MRSVRAFQSMWVAGTIGAFFAAFTRCVPLHLQEVGFPVNWEYTFDLLLRFSYATWFLAYFFISNLDNEASESLDWRNVVFDIVQSIASLMAVFWLGFTFPGQGFGVEKAGEAFATANAAITIICLSSWILFRTSTPRLHTIRLLGLAVSVVAVLVGIFVRPQSTLLWIGWPIFLLLSLLLYWLWASQPRANGTTLRQLEKRVEGLEARRP